MSFILNVLFSNGVFAGSSSLVKIFVMFFLFICILIFFVGFCIKFFSWCMMLLMVLGERFLFMMLSVCVCGEIVVSCWCFWKFFWWLVCGVDVWVLCVEWWEMCEWVCLMDEIDCVSLNLSVIVWCVWVSDVNFNVINKFTKRYAIFFVTD